MNSKNNSSIHSSEPIYAGISIRFLASAVDGLIATILFQPIYYLLKIKIPHLTNKEILANPYILYDLSLKFLGLTVFQFFFIMLLTLPFWIRYGATPGKMLFKIKIVSNTDLGKISIKQSIYRYLGYLLSTLPLALGFVCADFDKKRHRTLHDRIANTVVIKLKNRNYL